MCCNRMVCLCLNPSSLIVLRMGGCIVKLPQWFFFHIYDWSVLHINWHILKLCQSMSLSSSTDGRRLELCRTVDLCHFNWGNPITASIAHVNQSLLELIQKWGVHKLWAPVFYLLIKNAYIQDISKLSSVWRSHNMFQKGLWFKNKLNRKKIWF